MCGILGQWNFGNDVVNKSDFVSALNQLNHRGPDAFGSWFTDDLKMALGQRRLSIIDLSENANQPIQNENGNVQAVVNGEIYNYPDLKKQLEHAGHRFYTQTDSEIIVHGWEEWGVALPEKLEGMFSFAVFDSSKKCLFIARDRFGIKPLYYTFQNNHFVFASELKAIISFSFVEKQLDISSFSNFFVYRFIPPPNTIWKGISKLPPANSLLMEHGKSPVIAEYWKLIPGNTSENSYDVYEAAKELIAASVKDHLLSDVPVGTFLSGGYDSSALVLFQKEQAYHPITFSMGFEGWSKSEHLYGGIVSEILETEHHSELINGNHLELLDILPKYYDEPNGDISTIPTFLVSKLAAKNVKVVLSGEGADEIFAGYTWHKRLMQRYKLTKENAWERANGNPMSGVAGYAHAMAMGLFDKKELQKMLNPKFHSEVPENPFWFYKKHYLNDIHPLKAFQYLDIKTFMAELVLQKVDRATMANSLEARVPFLNHKLVEYMFSLNPTSYFNKKEQKPILRDILKPYLPDVILERKKQGFTGPDMFYQDEKWYSKEFNDLKMVKYGLVQSSYIRGLMEKKEFWKMWKVVVMEKWLRYYKVLE